MCVYTMISRLLNMWSKNSFLFSYTTLPGGFVDASVSPFDGVGSAEAERGASRAVVEGRASAADEEAGNGYGAASLIETCGSCDSALGRSRGAREATRWFLTVRKRRIGAESLPLGLQALVG